jgi:GntR family transcriptional repressor for pyruvate dehydrogenase complex
MYDEIKKNNICDQIVDRIKESILKGDLKPGDQLPNERQLAESFNVSRISVREALRSLRQMGFLQTRPGEGTFVEEINSRFLTNALSSYLAYNNRPIVEVLEMRELLEVKAAQLAAERADEEDIKQIKDCKDKVELAIQNITAETENDFYQADLEFHKAVVRASKNSLFEKVIDAIRETLKIHQKWSAKEPGRFESIMHYHNEIYQSIANKEGERAANFMYEHLKLIEEVLVKNIDNSAFVDFTKFFN